MVLLIAAAGSSISATAANALPLKIVHRDIALGGKPDRFDYQSVDPQRRLLFVAHLGSGMVTVIDLRNNRIVAQIPGLPGVHGVLAVPRLGEVFATATARNELDVISERTFRIIARAPAGVYPDGIAYDPRSQKLFVSDEAGDSETVFDIRTHRRIATVGLGGAAGNSQYDPVANVVLVAVQTLDAIVAIDPTTNRILRRYALPASCENDHSLLLDVPARLGFVACDGNAKLLLIDTRTMGALSVLSTGGGPDVLAYDSALRRLYVASESGVVAVFGLKHRRLVLLGRAFLAYEAHSVAVDPLTHDVYFPLENVGGIGVLRIMAPIGLRH